MPLGYYVNGGVWAERVCSSSQFTDEKSLHNVFNLCAPKMSVTSIRARAQWHAYTLLQIHTRPYHEKKLNGKISRGVCVEYPSKS